MMPKKKPQNTFLVILFVILVLSFLAPVFFNINKLVYSQPDDTDTKGVIYNFWWQKYSFLNHLPAGHNPLLNYPAGVEIVNYIATPLSDKIAYVFTNLFNEILAYNIITFINYIFLFIVSYILLKKLFNKTSLALFSSLVITISPYHLAQTSQHLVLSNIHWLVIFILSLIIFDREQKLRYAIIASASLALTVIDGYLYGLFALIVIMVWAISKGVHLFINRKIVIGKKKIINYIVMAILTVTIIQLFSPGLMKNLVFKSGELARNTYTVRSYNELAVYSAQWFNYVLPLPNNPIFGKYTKDIYEKSIKETGSNLAEQTLYLGWIPLLLLLYCYIVILFNKKLQVTGYKLQVLFFTVLGLAGLYFSFAPTINIFGLEIKTPAYWLFDWLPFIRVYARFGLLVLISAAVLAGIGLTFLLEQIKNKRVALSLYCFIALLLVVEFLNFPPYHTIDVSRAAMPDVYKWLEAQPRGAVAEYPLLPSEEPKSYDYLLWQRYHQMPLVYGAPTNSIDDQLRKTILDPSRPETIGQLKKIGVQYLIIHQDRYTLENAKKYPAEYNGGVIPIIKSDQAEFVGQFGSDEIYKLY